jgi:hypothetical protein
MLLKRRFWKEEQKMKSGFSTDFSMEHGPTIRRPNRVLTSLKSASKRCSGRFGSFGLPTSSFGSHKRNPSKTDVRPPNIDKREVSVLIVTFCKRPFGQTMVNFRVTRRLYHADVCVAVWRTKNGAMSHPRLNDGTCVREYSTISPSYNGH